MPSIDDKVVSMSFESSKFEEGVNKTINALDKLKAALQFSNAGKGLNDISAAAKSVDLGHISKGVEEVSSKLNALRLTAIAVFSQIASRVISSASSMLKSFTFQPIFDGFHEYETQLNAVQTILANTRAAGTNLQDVNAALNELNHYADKTIYNFSEMTKNIGTFTAAGVDLKTSVASIKGIANLAAVSGSNAQQASTAMYQLSQAISSGTVKLQDWNSVVNAGMGGTVFQRALAQTAEHMGTLKKGAVELAGPMKTVRVNGESFRNSLSAGPGKEGWLSSKVLTETLKQLSGDMTDAQLKAQGYTDAQIKAIQGQAKMAVEAATQVKTLSQLIDTTKEAIGSGWAQTWMIIFGDFGQAKKLFTGLSNAINAFVGNSARARNKVLKDWQKLGGRTLLLDSLKNAFHDLAAVVKPIKDAFRDIFPRTTGKQLYDLTVRFNEFTKMLKPSPATIDLLRRTFRGLFAILDIGKQILGGIFTVFGKVFGQIFKGSGGFLEITARIGDWLVKVDEALKKGQKLNRFFTGLGTALAAPIQFIQDLENSFKKLFSGAFSKNINGMTQALTPFQAALAAIGDAFGNFMDQLGGFSGIFQPVIDALTQGLQQLGPAVAQAISGMSLEPILQVIRTGLLAGIFLLFKNFLGKGSLLQQVSKGFAGGIIANISGSFKALQGTMVGLQQNIKAKTLKEIAIAVALLALSIVALSFVDPKKLNSAMSAITIAFAQLLGAMAIMDKITKSGGFIRLPVVATSLIILAAAIDTLSLAVIALSFLSWNKLIKGLTGVGALLGGLVLAAGPLSKASPRLIAAGVGLTAIAVALNILALAVRQLGSMNLSTLAKGLGGVAVGLGLIADAMRFMPKGMILQAAALIGIATALNVLAFAIGKLGAMNWAVLAKGMGAIALSLIAIAVAMRVMPKGMIAQAAALLLVSVALQGIARAVGILGGMSFEQLAKGLGSLAAALIILGTALIFMEESTAGAAALALAAAGIAVLAPALALLGKQSWTSIIKGLVSLAAAFAIIGVAAALITPAVPSLLGFGAALFLIGAGLALAGAGVFLIGAGLAAVAVSGSAAVAVLIQALVDLEKAIIENAKNLALGILEVVKAFADTAPQFVDAIVKILNSVIDGLIQIIPKLKQLMNVYIQTIIEVLHQQQGPVIQAGIDLFIALLNGIRNNIGQVTKLVVDIIVNFLNALKNNLTRIIAAGANLIIALLSGIAKNYARIVTAGLSIVTKFIAALVGGYGKIITTGVDMVAKLISGISKSLGRLIAAGANLIVNFITGIGNAGPRVIAAGTNTIIKFINALQQNTNKLADAGAKAIVAFMNGIARSINTYAPQMRLAGIRIAFALVDGMTFGLASKGRELLAKAGDLVNQVKNKLKVWKSPPSAFGEYIGREVVQGLANGLKKSTEAVNAAGDTSQGVIDMFNNVFQTASPSKVMYGIGLDVVAGFAQGLKKGTETDVKGAFSDMKSQLTKQAADLQKTINEEQKKQQELENKKKRTDSENKDLISVTKSLKEHEKALASVTRAQTLMSNGINVVNNRLKENKTTLIAHAKAYDALVAKIEAVKGIVQEFKDQYSQLPEIIKETTDATGTTRDLTGAEQLAAYTESLKKQAAAVQLYNEKLQQLRALGLDDDTYKKLLQEGTAGEQFAEALIAGGKPAIDSINALDSQVDTAAQALGDNAAKNLYKAGEEAAVGFVKGLEDQKAALEAVMDSIADKMVKRIKNKLKIKSPSEVFAEIGQQSMEGMAKGFSDSSKVMTDAVDAAAQDALTAMQQSMRNISDVVVNEIDPNPVITPILDLSLIRQQKDELAALSASATVSSGQAAAISTGTVSSEQTGIALGGPSFRFEQNNYSPEALSNIEIYRQTKNQMSQIRAALALT